MGKYLKEFQSHSDYNTYINSQDKLLPNVSYCVNENECHYNPIPSVIPPVGKVQVFANPQCTEYADGQSREVWVRLNQAFGFNGTMVWGNSSEGYNNLAVYTPTTEYPTDLYDIYVWVDWYSGSFTEPFTSGQVIKCQFPYDDPLMNNVQVIFE